MPRIYVIPSAAANAFATGRDPLEAALAPYGARPHWGKTFSAEAAEVAPLYERLPDFRALRDRLDPRGAFVNAWLERRVLGPGA